MYRKYHDGWACGVHLPLFHFGRVSHPVSRPCFMSYDPVNVFLISPLEPQRDYSSMMVFLPRSAVELVLASGVCFEF